MRIHQVLAGASGGDAITQIAFSTREVLRDHAESEVYAHHIDHSVEHVVRPLTTLPAASDPGDVILLRASIGDDEIFDALKDRIDRLWLCYHNISPPHLFADLDPAFAALLASGRDQLTQLRPRVELSWADSTFNADDLRSLGYSDVEVLSPMLNPHHLQKLEPEPGFALEIARRVPAELILSVGQILPHKRPELIVAAHHLLTAHHLPGATLVLVGRQRFPHYAAQIAAFGAALNLPRLWMADGITYHELAELYRRADVFVTASSHEGFCVPILEAMAMSTPVVASTAGAIPETAGGAAMLIDEQSPEAYAEAIAYVLEGAVRSDLILAGRERAESLSLERTGSAFQAFLEQRL